MIFYTQKYFFLRNFENFSKFQWNFKKFLKFLSFSNPAKNIFPFSFLFHSPINFYLSLALSPPSQQQRTVEMFGSEEKSTWKLFQRIPERDEMKFIMLRIQNCSRCIHKYITKQRTAAAAEYKIHFSLSHSLGPLRIIIHIAIFYTNNNAECGVEEEGRRDRGF
jgi:hypothetical protein